MVIKILFIFLALASILFPYIFTDIAQKDSNQFRFFCQKYGKNYLDSQIYYRGQVFNKNLENIRKHNQNKTKSYRLGVNSFADLTLEQFKLSYLGLTVNKKQNSVAFQEHQIQIQMQVDWKKEGKVTPVKNQKMCASCWAFCSIAALESAYLIQKAVNLSFSQQQLVDCSTPYGNKGCQGGELQYTFRYLQEKGVNLQSSYPYIAKNQNCKKTHGPYKMSGYRRELTCGGLYSGLLRGPVTVAVDALFWGFYQQGIYDHCGNEVNHGVLVVGAYKDYWLVKNSWGIQWGDNGYIKVKKGNTCSICEYPYSPLL